ncbi:MAG: GNAT family N-acetyltransferase [Firmicutes bacterium]|nr:GNAT family N-acetyltransferase [Bacillota bacterium]
MVEFRALKASEMDAWFDHCALVFDQHNDLEASRQYFMNHWYNDPWRERHGILVAVEDGEILSTVRVFHRRIYLAGEIFSMGGIGEVSTKEPYRRQGLSGKLLEMAIEYMKREDMDFSILATGSPRHYSRFGWEEVATYWKQAEIQPLRCGDIRLMNLQDPWELQQSMNLYHMYSCRFNGAIVRDRWDYWQDWVRTEVTRGWFAQGRGRGWVMMEAGELKAYLAAATDAGKDILIVNDFACREDEADSFRKLIQHAAWSLGNGESVKVVFPAAVASDFPTKLEARQGLMVRLNNKELWDRLPGSSISELFHGISGGDPTTSKLVSWGIDGY